MLLSPGKCKLNALILLMLHCSAWFLCGVTDAEVKLAAER